MFIFSKKTEYVFNVKGMHCLMCEKRVCDLIKQTTNASKVTASHTDGKVTVISKEPVTAEQIKTALKDTDFTVEE